MYTIACLDRATLPMALPTPNFPHQWLEFPLTNEADIVSRAIAADIVITNKVPFSAQTIAAIPNLKLIAVAATGTNLIDLDAAAAQGVAVCNVSGYSTHSVAEHSLMLMLALRRNLKPQLAQVQRGDWQASPQFALLDYPLNDLYGATLGIVGTGAIGQHLGRIAKAMGMQVLPAERKGANTVRDGYTAFDEVLARADIISVHTPLTPATRHYLSASELARMKPGAILINTARGGVVEEAALLAALDSGHLGGAATDVLSVEPPRHGNPLLAERPNLLVTPHVAWASQQSLQTLGHEVIENLNAFVAGIARHRVV
jgi:glycerate dehydrogenase